VRLAFLLLLFCLLKQPQRDGNSLKMRDAPPLYAVARKLVGWTLDRTADLPKNQRFRFGQRLDNHSR